MNVGKRSSLGGALAVTFSAIAAVRILPAASHDDPVAALDAVRSAIAGELWEDLTVPAIVHLLTESAEAAWLADVTRVPPGIDCPEAAEMLRLTGAPGFATAGGYAGLLVSNQALLDDPPTSPPPQCCSPSPSSVPHSQNRSNPP